MANHSTRTKLLDAAARAFLEHGFDATSMDLIRVAAGVSNGSLYHHFPTKSQLADALYAHTLREFHGAISEPISGGVGAQAGVQGLIRAYIRWVVTHPDRARLLHQLRRVNAVAQTQSDSADANQQAYTQLRQWVDQQVAAGDLRRMPFAEWMALVFAPVLSLTPQWVAQTRPSVPARTRANLEQGAWQAVAAQAAVTQAKHPAAQP
ncbi:MAG: TetR/AcrR family transcriptional regulator [Rhodoferax sp.]|nr:TetR/AcrR family transcriptional regulator [Rhodoferax sp.]